MERIEKKNRFLFCRNGEKNEFIFKNRNGSLERVLLNIKEIMNGADSFLIGTLTTWPKLYMLPVTRPHEKHAFRWGSAQNLPVYMLFVDPC